MRGVPPLVNFVGTGVLDCVRYLLFSGEEKRSKKVVGDYYRDCVPANAPGRNYKLLPALAIDSPPGCQCGYAAASRHATLFGMRENKRSFSHCRDRRPRLSEYGFGKSKCCILNRTIN